MKEDEAALQELCAAYLAKPIDKTGLIHVLSGFLQHEIVPASPAVMAAPLQADALPAEALQALHELIDKGAIMELQVYIDKLLIRHGASPFLQALHQAAEEFDIEKLELILYAN